MSVKNVSYLRALTLALIVVMILEASYLLQKRITPDIPTQQVYQTANTRIEELQATIVAMQTAIPVAK